MADYKIKDLENLSGIKAHTIRIWEKRYNLLSPSRTTTKIRTYTDADLIKLLNISILNENGWKISKIASLSDTELSDHVAAVSVVSVADNSIISLFIKSLTTIDHVMFSKVFDDCIINESLSVTFEKYLIPFLNRIGILWLIGTVNPAQEHFISNLIRQKLLAAIDQLEDSQKSEPDYILFCREGEWHELGLLYYYYKLKEQGFSILYLGQNLPVDDVKEVLIKLNSNPDVVSSFVSPIEEGNTLDFLSSMQSKLDTNLYIGGIQTDDLPTKLVDHVFDVRLLFKSHYS